MTLRRNWSLEKPSTKQVRKARPFSFASKMTRIERPYLSDGSPGAKSGPRTKDRHGPQAEFSKSCTKSMDGRKARERASRRFLEMEFSVGEEKKAALIIPFSCNVCR